jgi:predicted acyltransferase
VILGYVWGWVFPINKSLWTSSYAVLTAGQAVCALALCYWLIDVQGKTRWTRPFIVYGVNAITVYVASGVAARSMIVIQVPAADGGATSLQGWVFTNLFLPLASPINASLLFALAWVAGWWGVLTLMYRRNLIINV